jgi:MinD-like ATPase involved in chromosome partitioning or flagellar assembly
VASPENFVTLRLELDRMQAGFMVMVRNAIDSEMVAKAVKQSVSQFDFDAEVQRLVDREIRSALQNAVEAAVKYEMQAIRKKASEAMDRAAEHTRRECARALGVTFAP